MRPRSSWSSILVIFLTVGGVACSQNGTPKAEQPNAARVSAAQAEKESGKPQEVPGPTIPKDAQFTIYCNTVTSPDHAARIKGLRNQLLKNTPLRDWHIVQGNGQSTLYHGFYKDTRDPKAQADLKAVAGLRATNGDRLFMMAYLIPLEGADPTAPAEWNLENANGYYTLQIAVYRDSPQRKEYAVAAVKEARAAGFEAYYHHGPNFSVVCIGAWPETAVKETAEVRAQDPHEVVGVAPPSVAVPENLTTSDGRKVRMVRPTYEVLDPTLMMMKKKFPTQSINGLEGRKVMNPQSKQVRTVVDPSVVVKVPRKGPTVAGPVRNDVGADVMVAEPREARPDNAPGKASRPPTPVQPGGKLKSIEDK